MTLHTFFHFGPLRVLVNTETGTVTAVQDSLTGCAASLMYSQAAIAHATRQAQIAWASTAELA